MSAAFKKWFHGSRIVDASGAPRVVYHGTTAGDFSEFKPKQRKQEQLGFGIGHFTDDRKLAELYAYDENVVRRGGKPRVYEVYLSMRNPLLADQIVSEGEPEFDLAQEIAGKRIMTQKNEAGVRQLYLQNAIDMTSPARAEKIIREHGYDGVIYMANVTGAAAYGRTKVKSARSYLVFDPAQIKAVDNDGSFDGDDRNIQSNPKPKNSTKDATLKKVIKTIRDTDGTGDPEWVEGLIERASKYQNWKLGYLNPSDLNNYCENRETCEEYAEMGMETAPAAVVVPSKSGPNKYDILDGAHRAWAAEIAGVQVLAYYPDIASNPPAVELIVAYHGTTSKFKTFDTGKAGSVFESVSDIEGLYFTASPNEAESYAHEAAATLGKNSTYVIRAHLRITKPFTVKVPARFRDSASIYFDENRHHILDQAGKADADGIIVVGRDLDTTYIIFDEKQADIIDVIDTDSKKWREISKSDITGQTEPPDEESLFKFKTTQHPITKKWWITLLPSEAKAWRLFNIASYQTQDDAEAEVRDLKKYEIEHGGLGLEPAKKVWSEAVGVFGMGDDVAINDHGDIVKVDS